MSERIKYTVKMTYAKTHVLQIKYIKYQVTTVQLISVRSVFSVIHATA